MNIQQFYQKSATISLNASIVSIIPPFFLSLYCLIVVPSKQYILFIIPFLLYSIFSYQIYLINVNRAKETSVCLKERSSDVKILDATEMIITFLPAPSLRILLFREDGQQIGEVRDMRFSTFRWLLPNILDKQLEKKYGIYDELNQLVAVFWHKKGGIEIFPVNGESFFIEKRCLFRKELIFSCGEKGLLIKQSSLFTDYQIYKEKVMISRLRKGVMPLEWGERFIDPNIPVLTFAETLDEKEKLIIFAILSDYLRYTDH